MTNSPQSLSNFIHWTRILPALGVERIDTTILPAKMICPLCQGSGFCIFDDQLLGGQWCYCRNCEFGGDLIELAARIWELDVVGAVVRLANRELMTQQMSPERIEGYVRDHVQYRQRLRSFSLRASRELPRTKSPSMWDLLARIGLRDQVYLSWWPETGGSLLGCSHYHQVQELFHPESYAQQSRVNHGDQRSQRRGAGPGNSRLFLGYGWDYVLLLPFYDLPGRICGFLFVGRNGDPDQGDIFFKAANLQSNSVRFREAGLCGLQAADQGPHRIFGDTVFVVSDPLIALRLQMRTLRESSALLPIVVAHFDARAQTRSPLSHLVGKKLVFWGRTSDTLRLAKAANAEISVYPISDREVASHLRHREPCDWLRMIQKHAVPWAIALQQQLRRCDSATAEALLREMDFSPADLRSFIAGSDEELRTRLDDCSPLRLASRKVPVAGKIIVETDSGWWIERTGERVCSAPVRVEEVLRTSDERTFYRGIVKMPDSDCDFTVAATDADQRGLLPCVRDVLLGRGEGLLRYQACWAKHSVFIATELGQPRVRTAVDRIGWHAGERRFFFPTFSITAGGEIDRDMRPLLFDDPVPASHLGGPAWFLTPEILDALSSDRPEVAVFWGVAACIVQNLLAPVMLYYPRNGILLDGPGAQETGAAVARALGCVEVDLRRRTRDETVLEQLNRLCLRHDWPSVVSLPQGRALCVTSAWVEGPGPKNSILSLNEYASLSLATNPGFQLITSAEPAAPLEAVRLAAPQVLPLYLQDLCSRRFWIDMETQIRLVDLLQDMSRWFGRCQGNPAAVCRAQSILLTDGQPRHAAFLRLVRRLYDDGKLAVKRADCDPVRPTQPAIVYRPATAGAQATVWVPMQPLNRLLGKLGAPALNSDLITEALGSLPAFLGIADYQGDRGWSFDEAWWTSQYPAHHVEACAAR